PRIPLVLREVFIDGPVLSPGGDVGTAPSLSASTGRVKGDSRRGAGTARRRPLELSGSPPRPRRRGGCCCRRPPGRRSPGARDDTPWCSRRRPHRPRTPHASCGHRGRVAVTEILAPGVVGLSGEVLAREADRDDGSFARGGPARWVVAF